MRKFPLLWIAIILTLTQPAFASFNLALTSGLCFDYVRPSTLLYSMNLPGTPFYTQDASTSLGQFIVKSNGLENQKSMDYFLGQAKLDIHFAWLGEADKRNRLIIDLHLNALYENGQKALFPQAYCDGNSNFPELDIYYQGFFMGMNGYVKIGKYCSDMPSNWGGEINAPSFEFGYERKNCIKTFLSFSLYNWGYIETAWYTNKGDLTNKCERTSLDKPDSPYCEPWGNGNFGDAVAAQARYAPFDPKAFEKASLVSTFGLNVPILSLGELTLRVPFEVSFSSIKSFTQNFRLMPIVRLYLDGGFFFSNTQLGLALRKKELTKDKDSAQEDPEKVLGYTIMGKQELGFRYASIWETDLMLGFQSAGAGYNTYAFTKLNLRNPGLIHYGIYCPYVYEEVIPYTGHFSISVAQKLNWRNFLLNIGVGTFWALHPKGLPYRAYDSCGTNIGINYTLGLECLSLLGDGSCLKMLTTIFQPTQLSHYKVPELNKTTSLDKETLHSRHLFAAFSLVWEHTFR